MVANPEYHSGDRAGLVALINFNFGPHWLVDEILPADRRA